MPRSPRPAPCMCIALPSHTAVSLPLSDRTESFHFESRTDLRSVTPGLCSGRVRLSILLALCALLLALCALPVISGARVVASPPHMAESLRLSDQASSYSSEAAPQKSGGVASLLLGSRAGEPEAHRDVLRQSRAEWSMASGFLSWLSDHAWVHSPADGPGADIFSKVFR